MPAARRNSGTSAAEMLRRGRRVTWVAVALVVLTGLYNVTLLGPLDRVLQSGAALLLALKFMLVLAAVAVAGQRDFAQVPRLTRAVGRRRRSEPSALGDRMDGSRRAACSRFVIVLPRARRLSRLSSEPTAQRPVILMPEFFSL